MIWIAFLLGSSRAQHIRMMDMIGLGWSRRFLVSGTGCIISLSHRFLNDEIRVVISERRCCAKCDIVKVYIDTLFFANGNRDYAFRLRTLLCQVLLMYVVCLRLVFLRPTMTVYTKVRYAGRSRYGFP